MKHVFNKDGNNVFISVDAPKTEKLAPDIYVANWHPDMGFYLTSTREFSLPSVIYGDVTKQTDRFLKTWFAKGSNIGALLVGEKGSGKTLLAKSISAVALEKYKIPTIIVNSKFCGSGFNQFLDKIIQPCVVIFDEFEKVYEEEDQEQLLTLLDGTSTSNKMYVLTANDSGKVHYAFIGRPGRIHYKIEFGGISKDFFDDYVEKNLNNKEFIPDFNYAYSFCQKMNFDTMEKLVWESNTYNESPKEFLDILNFEIKRELSFDYDDTWYSFKDHPQVVEWLKDSDMWRYVSKDYSGVNYTHFRMDSMIYVNSQGHPTRSSFQLKLKGKRSPNSKDEDTTRLNSPAFNNAAAGWKVELDTNNLKEGKAVLLRKNDEIFSFGLKQWTSTSYTVLSYGDEF